MTAHSHVMQKGFIICVDDQPEVVGSLLTQLEHAVGKACEIEVAESAAEALAVIDELLEKGEQIDIVITDEIMPGMQGSKFLEIVHKRDRNIMTVILTGHAGFDDVVYAVNHAGLERCIKKPWDYNELKDTVEELVQKAKIKRLNDRLSQDLLAEKNKAEAIVHSIADGIIVFDGNDRITLVNRACIDILGCQEDDLVGKRILDVLELRDLIMLLIEASHRTNEVVSDEIVIRREDDPSVERSIIATARTLRDKDDFPMGVVTILRDVTQEKEVNRLKANFLSTVSHELRTPISSILSTFELLLQETLGDLNADQRDFISLSRKQGEELSELIDNLIDVTGLEANQIDLNPSFFDIGLAAQEVAEIVQETALAKGLQFKTIIAPDLPKILADKPKIIRMLRNVLLNAIKFTESGAVSLSMAHEENSLLISVADSGIGIAEEHFERIFEKFYQVDNTSTREFGGSGLGLAICKAIVKAHHGRIWVESALHEGATFHIQLPCVPISPKALAQNEATDRYVTG